MPLLWAFDPSIKPPQSREERARSEKLGRRGTTGDGVLNRDGKPFEFELLVNDAERADIATLIQAQLKKVA